MIFNPKPPAVPKAQSLPEPPIKQRLKRNTRKPRRTPISPLQTAIIQRRPQQDPY